MRRFICLGVIILCLFLGVQTVQAGNFYLHEHPDYWWYVVEDPAFSAIIPSGADNYIERSIFGMESLLMTFKNGTITMEVNVQPGTDVESVRNSLDVRYKPLVKNITVLNNGEITTSNNLQTHFYAYEATGANGKKVMFRTVIFQRRHHVVYLTLFLESAQYVDDMREYWIRAVNGFQWD
ncbi:MAG: hypothetical protein GX249_00895 [Firmicutes bacterium]|nr:hypothetical protein [Bacillota bacterium]